jgi:hypothetical protein
MHKGYTHGYPSNSTQGQQNNNPPPVIAWQAPNTSFQHLSSGLHDPHTMNTHPHYTVQPSQLASTTTSMQQAVTQQHSITPYPYHPATSSRHQDPRVQPNTPYSVPSHQGYSGHRDPRLSQQALGYGDSETRGQSFHNAPISGKSWRTSSTQGVNSFGKRAEDSPNDASDVEWPKRQVSRKRYQPSKPEQDRRDRFLTNMENKAEERSQMAEESCGEDSDY